MERWLARDPLARLRQHLIARGLLDQSAVAGLDAEAEAEAAALRQRMNAGTGARSRRSLPARLRRADPGPARQRRELAAEMAAAADDAEEA